MLVMKKLSLFFIFFLSVSSFAKEIPTPFWYTISEKILAGTHQLISPEEAAAKPAVKKVQKPAKAVRVPLKCQAKHEKKVLPTPFYTITSDSVWSDTE